MLGLSQFFLTQKGDVYKSKSDKKIITALEKKRINDSIASIEIVADQVNDLMQRQVENKRFNGSVLLAKHGKVLFNKSYGFAEFDNKTKLGPRSVYQLASVSKQFTAAAIMLLVDREMMSVDDSVSCYYPNFPYPAVTVRQLLNHTSGLPMYFWLVEHKWSKQTPPSNQQVMNLFEEHDLGAYFTPGRAFDYSNTGYMILASIVEKVANQSFSNFVNDNIFKPLEMNQTFIYRYTEDRIIDCQLNGYRKGSRKYYRIGGTVNDRVVGDKNVYSTTQDLLKWINGLNSGALLSKELVDQMYTHGTTQRGRLVPYGFGFRLTDLDGQKLIYHNGRWNGFRTTIRQYTLDNTVIIILEHTSYRGVSKLANELNAIINENYCL